MSANLTGGLSPTSDISQARVTPTGATTARSLRDRAADVVNVKDFGAVGDDVADDTSAIAAAQACAVSTGAALFFPPGTYRISTPQHQAWLTWTSKSGVRIIGQGATLHDVATPTTDPFTEVLRFDATSNVEVTGLDYVGTPVSDPATRLGYDGAIFVRVINGSSNIRVQAKISHARYGVQTGEYADPTKGGCNAFRLDLVTYRVGYPVAAYLAEDVEARVNADGVHRAVYLAGVAGARIDVASKNQYVANVLVLLTDAMTGAGTSRGTTGVVARARDTGSTVYQAGASLFGLNPSRADAGIMYGDLDLHGEVTATDTVAATVGLYQQTATVNATLTVNGLRLSGLVDRSAQTGDTDTTGVIYIYATNAGQNQTMRGVTLRDLVIRPSPANTRASYVIVPGLQERVLFDNVTAAGLSFQLASTSTLPIELLHSTTGALVAGGTCRLALMRSSVASVDASLAATLTAWESSIGGVQSANLAVAGESDAAEAMTVRPTFRVADGTRNAAASVRAWTKGNAATYPLVVGLEVDTAFAGASDALTRVAGLRVKEQAAGDTAGANLHLGDGVPSGGQWNIYAPSTRENFFAGNIRLSSTSTGPRLVVSEASPEGAVTAPVGSVCLRTNGGAGTTLYIKESGSGNTGWVGK